MSLRIRRAGDGDVAGIREVLLAAFPSPAEAMLVHSLDEDRSSEISLVAEDEGQVVGHVLLSRMEVEGDGRPYRALGLAPVAVRPNRQREGIGAALIVEALKLAEEAGEELVFVVGEPDYYRRFGFDPATAAPFVSPYAGSYFMAKTFGAPLPASGTAAYAPAFARLP